MTKEFVRLPEFEKQCKAIGLFESDIQNIENAILDNPNSGMFESIKQGLTEAVAYERGNLPNVKVDKITVSPLREYSGDEVKAIRTGNNMTQKLFAEAMGVSAKTVEAWETGANSPSGTARRMLELITSDNAFFEKYLIVRRD